MEAVKSGSAAKALFWKLAERFGVQAVQLFFQLWLARLLEPAHYGALAMMMVFVSLGNTLVRNGLHPALIQKKNADIRDFSAALWASLAATVIFCLPLFCAAPQLAVLCGMEQSAPAFRALLLSVFPYAAQSVLLALAGRRLHFLPVFFSGMTAAVMAGTAALLLAENGFGLWALVVQNLLYTAVSCALLWILLRFKPVLSCDLRRLRPLLAFGWKLIAAGLLDTAYQSLYSLVIGRKYSAEQLGFYSCGRQLPQVLAVGAGDGLHSILLPVLSAGQADHAAVKRGVRRAVSLSAYLIFPLMALLAGAAEPLLSFLLTEKWLPAAPFLRVFCLSFALYPVSVCHLQAINAIGRSDVFLKLELVKKAVGTIALLAAVLCFDRPVSLALAGAAVSLLGCAVNGWAVRRLLGYTYSEQLFDLLPTAGLAILVYSTVRLLGAVQLPLLGVLLLQGIVGVSLYLGLSALLRVEPFIYLIKLWRERKAK